MDIELTDTTDLERECVSCGGTILVQELKPARGACPHCGHPIRIRDEHGTVVVKPPAKARREKEQRTPWLPAVQAFCDLAHIRYADLPNRTKADWAQIISEIVGNATPAQVAEAIPMLDVWNGDGKFSNPRQTRFREALALALAGEVEEDIPDLAEYFGITF